MKVLIVNSLTPSHGSTYRARLMAKAARECGWEAIYLESNTDLEASCAISIPQADNISGFILGALLRAYYCIRLDYDLCIVSKATPLTVLCVIIPRLKRRRVILDIDDLDSAFQTSPLRAMLCRAAERLLPPLANTVTTHNRFLRDAIKNFSGRYAMIIPQVIDTQVFDPDCARVRASVSLPANVKCVAYECTFTEGGARDADFIFLSIKQALTLYPSIHLVLIGGGPLRNRLEQRLAQLGITSVTVTGVIPQSMVAGYLSRADLCVVYMRDDAANRMRMSFKTLEYLAMEKPVVASLVGQTQEDLGGYCVQAGISPESFAKAIAGCLGGRIAAPGSCRSIIKERYSLQAMKNAMEKVIGENTVD